MSAVPKDDTKREAGIAMTGPPKDQTVLVVGRGEANKALTCQPPMT